MHTEKKMHTEVPRYENTIRSIDPHSGRESSIVDPMRLADWPMAYIGDMVPLAL